MESGPDVQKQSQLIFHVAIAICIRPRLSPISNIDTDREEAFWLYESFHSGKKFTSIPITKEMFGSVKHKWEQSEAGNDSQNDQVLKVVHVQTSATSVHGSTPPALINQLILSNRSSSK